MSRPDQTFLVPAPRGLEWLGGTTQWARAAPVVCAAQPAAVRRRLEELAGLLQQRDGSAHPVEPGGGPHAALRASVQPSHAGRAQGYNLRGDAKGFQLAAQDEAGLLHGLTTLGQMLSQGGGDVPSFRIDDAPDFPVRGVMLDISRDKVPTLETLFHLVDLLASWKINHLQLYTEHTFRYERHPEASASASPLTAAEIRALDLHCEERGIELVPNQNSFGHLHRWLKLPAYRHLAECEGEFDTPWGEKRRGPFSLNPTDPRSLDLLADWYDELLPCFRSRLLNVGCDETFDLGCGKSAEACRARGKGRVYLEFLAKIRGLVEARGHTMLFWADVLLNHPELVAELTPGVVPLIWGYEADHPFADPCAAVSAAGHGFFVCPGTSSWLSLGGRWANARANLLNAAEAGLRHGAHGYLVTDWGDQGHWQYLPISMPGLLYGAALSWGVERNRDLPVAEALNRCVFADSAGVLGSVLLDVGNLYQRLAPLVPNQSQVFRLLRRSEDEVRRLGLDAAALPPVREALNEIAARLTSARPLADDGPLLLAEVQNTVRMMEHACRRGEFVLRRAETPDPSRAAWRRSLADTLQEHRRLWLARNRPGGLADSIAPLEALRAEAT